MKIPQYPDNEVDRLDTLRALHLLDTAPEERFDRLTRVAKRLFNVPIALVSLVDVNRQWFKSCQGLPTRETPREISFCGHAILGSDVFIVNDTLLDYRFCDNPLVVNEPKIRFYAGVPLRVSKGITLGTLCLIDHNPRVMNSEDQSLLCDLGRMAEQELAAARLATIDDLTQILNRRGFMAVGSHTLKLCQRLQQQAALLLFDLDGFKAINDQYGHAAGDRALITFADILKDTFRDADVIGRLGGDEFVALLSQVDATEIEQILKRLDRNLADDNTKATWEYTLAYSVGTAAYKVGRSHTLADLLQVADQQMYAHKRQKGD